MSLAPDAVAGTIYDIGYRNYQGERLGRGYAFRTLFVHSLRSAFGLGRGGRSLWIPWFLFVAINFPAALQVGVGAMLGQGVKLIEYHNYFGWVGVSVALFCAAQAPELVSRDQHNRLLPLYFSRALRTTDYALAKLAAMSTAVFILCFTPLFIILIGRFGMATAFGAAVRAESGNFLPILGAGVVGAAVLGTLSLSLSSLVSRRGIASAMVLGLYLVTFAVAGILSELKVRTADYGMLLNPVFVVQGAILALFGKEPGRGGPLAQAHLPPSAYLGAVPVIAVLFTALLLYRYSRIRT
jgi:ABC-2 type transport system permease protein